MSNTVCDPTKEQSNSVIESRQNSPVYRPDIDGLRAIAVSAVLFFHARLGLSGGFLGVDVFFVISGFLITSLILKDVESADGFSILRFWERRIRRILPALLVVILSTVIGGWFVLLPSHFQNLGKSVLAQAVFSGNFFFWASAGYFADGANRLPLLHTWSLAVEEQFYVFFPMLFLLRAKWKRSSLVWIIGLSAIASLALGFALTRFSRSASFFLLPPRAWELLGGALVALAPRSANIPRWCREILGWSGLLAIGAAFWPYNANTVFPHVAILPCLGTISIIWVNGISKEPSTLARLLSIRPFVFLGKISYSLYLWHWPILVYAWYWQDNTTLPCSVRGGLLLLSVVLATLSWKFVETPFRTRRVFPHRRGILVFGVAAPVCCALIGAALLFTHGMPSRFSEAVLRLDVPLLALGAPKPSLSLNSTLERAQRGDFPKAGKSEAAVQCLVWGDSHAMALFPAFDKLADDSACGVEFATKAGTAPVLSRTKSQRPGRQEKLKLWLEAVVENVQRKRIPNVVLAGHWSLYFKPDRADPGNQEVAEAVRETVAALQQAGAKVWIFKTVPEQPRDISMAMARFLLKGGPGVEGVSQSKYMQLSQAENELFAPAVLQGAVVLDPFPVFFDHRETCLVESSGQVVYMDDNHLTPSGSLLLSELLRPALVAPPRQ